MEDVTPANESVTRRVKGLKTIAQVQVERLPRLIDSTNMLTEQRTAIATMIYDRRDSFDGFVIVHGTDIDFCVA